MMSLKNICVNYILKYFNKEEICKENILPIELIEYIWKCDICSLYIHDLGSFDRKLFFPSIKLCSNCDKIIYNLITLK